MLATTKIFYQWSNFYGCWLYYKAIFLRIFCVSYFLYMFKLFAVKRFRTASSWCTSWISYMNVYSNSSEVFCPAFHFHSSYTRLHSLFQSDNISMRAYEVTPYIVSRRNTINCLRELSNQPASSREALGWAENFHFLRITLDKAEERASNFKHLRYVHDENITYFINLSRI